MIGVCSVNGMYSPHISYGTIRGGFVDTKIGDIGVDTFRSMSPASLDAIKHVLQSYQSYVQFTTTIDDDEFTADDAYFALNGAKTQLKEALKETCPNKIELLKGALSCLNSIRKRGYEEISGYKYCLAVLCLHFWENMDDSTKTVFFGSSRGQFDISTHGSDLMSLAAKSKADGGDDDSDAASYLQCKK